MEPGGIQVFRECVEGAREWFDWALTGLAAHLLLPLGWIESLLVGAVVGSTSLFTSDIFMEGVQYRTVKLWSKGERVEEMYRLIEDNTRFPEELMGDIEAQLAGCLLGRDLTAKLAQKFGVATWRAALARPLINSTTSRGSLLTCMTPDSKRTRSKRSLMSFRSLMPLECIVCSVLRVSSSTARPKRCIMFSSGAMSSVRGVRSSWLMLAKNSLFNRSSSCN